tara:strand:+ start:344 stop:553 length:210 start_codon:yes stop_codon:yes gene_type:complete
MDRKYGQEQREEVEKIKNELKHKIEQIYLETFEKLSQKGLGNGTIARLTQLLLISREEALRPLNENEIN